MLRTKDTLEDRTFNSFYDVDDGRFTSMMLTWSALIAEGACLQEEQKIAVNIGDIYGIHDRFAYFDETKNSANYLWRFPNGATITVSNPTPKVNDCSVNVIVSEKSDVT